MKHINVLAEAFSDTGDELAIAATNITKGKDGSVMSWKMKYTIIDDNLKETNLKVSSSASKKIENAIGQKDIMKGIEMVNDKETVIMYTEVLEDEKGKKAIKIGNKTIKL